ncbi:MAG: transporter [Rhodothermaceae bacterium]|nr:transporter [Rhodothermaceae bacterium]
MDAAFALALLRLDGVGRVTAHRLLDHFPEAETLRACPREQVLLRIKGAPRADKIVARLFDEATLDAHLVATREEIATLAERRIAVLTPGHPHWPDGLAALPRSERPVVLYAFGSAEVLATEPVALFGQTPLPTTPFETAQTLARRLIAEGIPLACGARSGFDVVLHKLATAAAHPCVLVARTGLAQIDAPARPSVAAVVKAGGVLVSPFRVRHGPFDHDDTERALVQAALAGPCAFFAPRTETPEARALAWALEQDRPVFGLADEEIGDKPEADTALTLPDRVHRLNRPVDLDWVVAASRGTEA